MGLPIAFVVTGGEVPDYKRQRPCAKALDFLLSSELIYRLSKSDGFLSKAVIAAFRNYVIKRVFGIRRWSLLGKSPAASAAAQEVT